MSNAAKGSNPGHPSPTKISLDEYFELEYASDSRHEYLDGILRAMAYTSENHGIILHNLNRLIGNCLLEKDCIVISSDRMLYVPEYNRIYYSDLIIVCGQRQYLRHSKKMKATINPSVIIEVLSDSTENADKGKKWQSYRSIPSLKQYILVSQDEKYIETFDRIENSDKWINSKYANPEHGLPISDCILPIRDIYLKVDFENNETETPVP